MDSPQESPLKLPEDYVRVLPKRHQGIEYYWALIVMVTGSVYGMLAGFAWAYSRKEFYVIALVFCLFGGLEGIVINCMYAAGSAFVRLIIEIAVGAVLALGTAVLWGILLGAATDIPDKKVLVWLLTFAGIGLLLGAVNAFAVKRRHLAEKNWPNTVQPCEET